MEKLNIPVNIENDMEKLCSFIEKMVERGIKIILFYYFFKSKNC